MVNSAGKTLSEKDFTHLVGGNFISPSSPKEAASTTLSPKKIPNKKDVRQRRERDPLYCIEQVRSARFCQSKDEGREQVRNMDPEKSSDFLYFSFLLFRR